MKFSRPSFFKRPFRLPSQISNFSSEKIPVIKDFLHYAGVPLLFALSFLAGEAAQVTVQHFRTPEAVTTASGSNSWGLSFQEEGKRPVGNASMEELAPIMMPILPKILRRKKSTLPLTADMKTGIPL